MRFSSPRFECTIESSTFARARVYVGSPERAPSRTLQEPRTPAYTVTNTKRIINRYPRVVGDAVVRALCAGGARGLRVVFLSFGERRARDVHFETIALSKAEKRLGVDLRVLRPRARPPRRPKAPAPTHTVSMERFPSRLFKYGAFQVSDKGLSRVSNVRAQGLRGLSRTLSIVPLCPDTSDHPLSNASRRIVDRYCGWTPRSAGVACRSPRSETSLRRTCRQ